MAGKQYQGKIKRQQPGLQHKVQTNLNQPQTYRNATEQHPIGSQPQPLEQQPQTRQQNKRVAQITIIVTILIITVCLVTGIKFLLMGFPLYIVSVPMVIAVIILIFAGYTSRWFEWTGFGEYKSPPVKDQGHERAKTLWDWLQLFAVPIMVALVTIWFSAQQNHDLQISTDQQQQVTLETYLDRMSDLLLNNKLNDPNSNINVRALAEARTYTALRSLDGTRKGILLLFLYTSNLIKNDKPIISMSGADLSGIDLRTFDATSDQITLNEETDLSNVDLSGANLSGANLSYVNLQNADLSGAILNNANLNKATLNYANLQGTLQLHLLPQQ